MIHRDVKPGNLLLDASGRLWVTDFGLARCRTEPGVTLTGDLVGTLRYMSPEQALAKPGLIDHRSDIYSLGATMYELLTLQPIFDGRDREQLLRQIAIDEPKPMRRIDSTVPRRARKGRAQGHGTRPMRRYDSADELADDLRRFLEDRPVLARRPTLGVRAAKFARRHRSIAIAAGSMLVATIIGLIIAVVLIWHQKELTKQALKRQEAETCGAEENFRRVLGGTQGLLLRVENPRWDKMNGIGELRKDVVDEGLSFFRNLIDETNPEPAVRFESAQTYRLMSTIYCVRQDAPEALAALAKAGGLLQDLIKSDQTQWRYYSELASVHSLAATLYVSLHQPDKARPEFDQAVAEYWCIVSQDSSGESANACAWILTDCPIVSIRNPKDAVTSPNKRSIGPQRNIDSGTHSAWPAIAPVTGQGAVTGLQRSNELNAGGNAWDWFFLAMAYHRLGDKEQAHVWKEKALNALKQSSPQPQDLLRYQKEITDLMGDTAPQRGSSRGEF